MKDLTRILTVGDGAGKIVDTLMQMYEINDADFWYCDSNLGKLLSHGPLTDPHIGLTKAFNKKCIDALHVDNEMVAIIVASLEDEVSYTYLYDIVEKYGVMLIKSTVFLRFQIGKKKVKKEMRR